jgi:hypothetical protein
MPMLSAVSNELYVNKAFVGLNGAGYQIAGGYELAGTGVPKRKIKKAIKDTGKFLNQKKGKIARSVLNLASEFGSPAQQDAVEKIRRGQEIIKGSGHTAPGAALRRLVK